MAWPRLKRIDRLKMKKLVASNLYMKSTKVTDCKK